MKKLPFLSTFKHAHLFIGKLIVIAACGLLIAGQTNAQTTDTTAPEINDFNLPASSIDTTERSQNVTVAVRVTDNDKGVNMVTIRFRSASGNQFVNVFMNSQQRISGDDKDGIYRAEATFPQYSKAGAWSVLEIEARDAANNYKTVSTSELLARGFAAELQVISNNEDVAAPQINDFSFASSVIDTTNNPESVAVTIRAIDNGAGVRSINVQFSLSSTDYPVEVELNSQNRVSGDSKDGLYKAVLTFPQGTDSGMWRAAVFVTDALGNSKYLNSDELAASGFAAQLQIIGKPSSTQPAQKSRKRVRFF